MNQSTTSAESGVYISGSRTHADLIVERTNRMEDESPLLSILPLIQRLVFSCVDRKEFPYTKSQMSILTVLSLRSSLTMKDVAGYLSSSQEQATRSVAPLVDANLVERFTEPSNRVHVHVRLTDAGRAYLWHISGLLQAKMEKRLESSITADQAAKLKASLQQAMSILQEVR